MVVQVLVLVYYSHSHVRIHTAVETFGLLCWTENISTVLNNLVILILGFRAIRPSLKVTINTVSLATDAILSHSSAAAFTGDLSST